MGSHADKSIFSNCARRYLRRFEGKMANFENYSSFHEHGSAFWRFECATFRFALMVGGRHAALVRSHMSG